jgi:hypothetical protein
VDRGTVLVVHLVELVNQAQALVCEDQGATLKGPLTSDRVLVDTCSKTDGRRSFACGINASVENLLNILKELRLGSARVSKKKAIDITSYSVLSIDIF